MTFLFLQTLGFIAAALISVSADSNCGKGSVVPGLPPPEYSTEGVGRQGQRVSEMDVGMARCPLRETNAVATGVVPKSGAAKLPVING